MEILEALPLLYERICHDLPLPRARISQSMYSKGSITLGLTRAIMSLWIFPVKGKEKLGF